MKKTRLTVILPANAVKEIHARMIEEEYSLREKSKWISEAIEDFLQLKEFQTLVEMAELVDHLVRQESVYITPEIEEKMQEAILKVRQQYPMLEAVKSLIVRASIVHRLVLHPKKKK